MIIETRTKETITTSQTNGLLVNGFAGIKSIEIDQERIIITMKD